MWHLSLLDKIYVIKKIELNKIKNEKEKELCLKQMDTLKTIII